MKAVKGRRKKKVAVRVAKPVNRVVTTSPEKLKGALPKRDKCLMDGERLCLVNGRKHPEGGNFVCDKAGRSRGLCVNHYNMLCRLVRRKETTWKAQEKKGLAYPAGRRVASEGTMLFLDKGGKRKKKNKK